MIAGLLFLVAAGSTTRCPLLPDPDDRSLCFAGASGNSSYCHVIKDETKRTLCYALVHRPTSRM